MSLDFRRPLVGFVRQRERRSLIVISGTWYGHDSASNGWAGVMHRALVGTLGFVVVASCLGTPQAAADDQICASTPSTVNCFFTPPSGASNCELDYDDHRSAAYCQTGPPPESVVMDANGALKICKIPQSCLGNPPHQLTLNYGQTAKRGPFTCRSAPSGVTCRVPSGKGFSISPAEITPVG
jgi:hypothetical protein